ncbi:MAG: NAD-dependent epimerase/dehydratase family protein [Clostridium sp.]|uniref:NAD-dependent epimerase/dehydratase family protein n=1 Tax=Clostridium sp. TaxID=1506 RepID=UPI0025BFF858|nr:NAD-dependent epimerase/dehydratase family protein [Clostridium sp.]MCF0149676.1 NAD-dependent epimerase/dehydratase family protein [Clostridium sp.]
MKNILITGANSYIGTSFEKWLEQWPSEYKIYTVDMKDGSWKEKSFKEYDVVFHVAGIAHVSTDPKMEDLYYKVNRDLTIETAKQAKAHGVKQFIFMSSIIVYGDSSNINKKRIIDKNTIPTPSNFYGESKLQAEKGILELQDDSFNIVILRPPMIYGKGSKGNYQLLSKIAKKTPIFPKVDNERSMLHIDNLCEFIRLMIENKEKGVFFPQNEEYVNTSELVKTIAEANGKTMKLTRVFNPALKLMGSFTGVVNKAFGSLVYEKDMSKYVDNYRVRNFKESIISTEGTKL